MLNTLQQAHDHKENFLREDSIVMRMNKLKRETPKPWVAVVDAGRLYDPMVQKLTEQKIPTFRTADRALRLFNIFCHERMK